jgi:hypothetical protein
MHLYAFVSTSLNPWNEQKDMFRQVQVGHGWQGNRSIFSIELNGNQCTVLRSNAIT